MSPRQLVKSAVTAVLGRDSRAFRHLYHRVYAKPKFPSVGDIAYRYAVAHRHREVTFAQIGANEGATEDVLYYPALAFGWRGVLVEPQAAEFARLRENYRANPKLSFENAAIVADPADVPELHYVVREEGIPAWVSKLSSFDRRIPAQVLERFPGASLASRPVRGMLIDDLLDRHDLRDLDVLLVDTEGHDYEILKLLDWERTRPALVVYEYRHLSAGDEQRCRRELAARGYALFRDRLDVVAIADPDVREAYAGVLIDAERPAEQATFALRAGSQVA